MSPLLLLKVSRPGLWLVFIWLFLWPTGGEYHLLYSPRFWMGLVYCTFPLNLLVYGMNDLVDIDVDKNNPRKGNFIYGAKVKKSATKHLPLYMALFNVVPLVLITIMDYSLSAYLLLWFASAFAVNFAYNCKPFQLSRKCPYELPTMILGHLLIPLLACRINNLPFPSVSSTFFHVLLLSRSHIWLEYADIAVDKTEGKRTIAVVLGTSKTLRLVIAITVAESLCGFFLVQSVLLGLFSLFGIVVFLLASNKDGTVKEEKMHVSISQSVVGGLLMIYLWINRIFV